MSDIPLEKVIVNDILKWLKQSGYKFIHKTHGSAYAPAGLPDIITIDRYGRFVGLECKRPKVGRLTQLQAKVLDEINSAGGYAVVVHSVSEARDALASSEAGFDYDGRWRG